MVTEDYISFDTAKLLKKKGFNWNTDKQFNLDKIVGDYNITDRSRYPEKYLDAPTLQMAMKWLREAHNQIIIPGIRMEDPISGIINCYIVGIWYIPKNNGGAFCYTSPTPYEGYPSYEEACEAGIKYCLENLI
jgi:hypothetical protein